MMATSSSFRSCAEEMSPLLNLPFELRAKVWFNCISNARMIAEIISPNLFASCTCHYNGPRPYFVFLYSFRSEGVLIWGIRKLPIIFACKMVFDEVVPIVKSRASLSFRGLDFWDLDRLRRMPECKRVRRVTVGFAKDELREGDEGARALRKPVVRGLIPVDGQVVSNVALGTEEWGLKPALEGSCGESSDWVGAGTDGCYAEIHR